MTCLQSTFLRFDKNSLDTVISRKINMCILRCKQLLHVFSGIITQSSSLLIMHNTALMRNAKEKYIVRVLFFRNSYRSIAQWLERRPHKAEVSLVQSRLGLYFDKNAFVSVLVALQAVHLPD